MTSDSTVVKPAGFRRPATLPSTRQKEVGTHLLGIYLFLTKFCGDYDG